LILNVESCHIQLPSLLYYSHWPSIIISLFFGIFVFLKSGQSLLGKILLLISASFSIWAILNLIVWITFDSRIYSLSWSFFEIVSILFFFLVLYFVYVFIEGKDIPFKIKLLFIGLFSPVIVISATKYFLIGFDATNCVAIENSRFLFYVFILKAIAFLGTLILVLSKYFKYRKDKIKKSKIIFVGIGSIFLLLSFLATQYIANFIFFNTYEIEFYGLFAITIFMGFLAYLIVKYKAFNIKLIGAQALVVGLILLVGSQYFYVQNATSIILTGITLALSLGFGYVLIKSVRAEVQRKEELQYMSDQLAKANDQLRKLDNAKSDFISIASHQLRTPLTSIKGFISLLTEGSYGKLTPVQQETLDKVYQSNERLLHLVEDLLNISRIESGRMEFQFAPCQLANLCQEVVDGLSVRAKDSKLYLDYKNPVVPLPEIMIDAGKVREVISNMVDNALKYTPKGGVTIRVERGKFPISKSQFPNNNQNSNLKNSKEIRDVIRVTVTDTGIGIPATELPYLFSKFSRGKDVGRLNVGGTGLGLYVGKSMIEANGGKIWAESEGEGKGSQFIIELPIQQSTELLAQWGK
jgi:signal transduction histidine kinase